jgi:hypothetical protein
MIRIAAGKLSSEQAILADEHIPATSFDNPADADYPTAADNDYDLNGLWIAEQGSVYWGNPTEEDVRFCVAPVDALRMLQVR